MTKKPKPKAGQAKSAVKQRRTRFIKEYLKDKNATRAAIAAGFAEKTAYSQGSRLLKNVEIKSQIETEFEKVNKKLDVSVERVLLEMARLAYFDPQAFVNPDGSVKPLSEVDEDSRRAIAGFEVAELFEGNGEDRGLAGYIKKFKLADKGANLERLAKHLDMFKQSKPIDVNITVSLADTIAKARKRVTQS